PDGAAKLVQGEVKSTYCPDRTALASDYPSYSPDGKLIKSADAEARAGNDGIDHYSRFRRIKDAIQAGTIETWNQSPKVGKWTAKDLTTDGYDPNDNPHGLASPEAI
ncbi:hypothetical protein, partial [Escherichia coli]